MARYLITMSIGPVQDFIAAARRTRDLWFGSQVLSKVSKAAAVSLNNQNELCENLIFPSPKNLAELVSENYSVGNKLLAVVETDDPDQALALAKQAATSCWLKIASDAYQKAQKYKIKIHQERWDQQVDDVLECFGAWVKFDSDSEYKQKRHRLDQLLNARKNTREFKPNPTSGNNIPKSSLDGLRESVNEKSGNSKADQLAYRQAGLNANEFLDCTGIVKRLGDDPEQFTPISRVALKPLLEGLGSAVDFSEIHQCLSALVTDGITSRVKHPVYSALPFDGQLLYPFRLEAELNRYKKEADSSAIVDKLTALQKAIETQQLASKNSEALPYMAVLAADGDRMGRLLSTMTGIEDHRGISACLASFAMSVEKIVEDHEGHCIYAGGDDVLALLPLDTAIQCSKVLADTFQHTMSQVSGIAKADIPTLSVGLGVSHFMTPMGKQRDLAQKAEKLAKGNELLAEQQKNALAIIVAPRSGAEIDLRIRWDEGANETMQHYIDCYNRDLISHKTAYDLREEAIAIRDWCDLENPQHQKLLISETRRILKRKRTQEDAQPDDKTIDLLCDRAAAIGLARLADELILMRRFAQAVKLATPPNEMNTTEENHDA